MNIVSAWLLFVERLLDTIENEIPYIMSEQKQVNEGGNATLSIKVPQATYDLLNILAEGLEHGTNANDLLRMFVQAFIESAKHTGPVSPDMELLLSMLTIDEGWSRCFNFADVKAQKKIARMVLVLQQPGRKGFGLSLIDRPFVAGEKPQVTYCLDSILECVAEVSMKGLYDELRKVGHMMGTLTLRETLLKLIKDYHAHSMRLQFEEEGPQLGNYHDFGRAIEYGKRMRRIKHRDPDSVANSQQRIIFEDYDREISDYEVQGWEGEHVQREDKPEGC